MPDDNLGRSLTLEFFLFNHCATLWIGKAMGRIERACLRSVLRQGHKVTVYCYQPPDGLPEGIEVRDAAEVVSEQRVVRHHTGSVSLFSNLFRYELQRQGLGTWLDCDAYLLAPLDMGSPYLFGEEEPRLMNTGILRIPTDSPILPGLIEPFDEKKVPRWLHRRARLAAQWRLWRSGRTGIANMPWGSLGPRALTAMVHEYQLEYLAVPPKILYPVGWEKADWIRRADLRLEDVVSDGTVSIHLWNERIKHFKEGPAPRSSFLARLQDEGA